MKNILNLSTISLKPIFMSLAILFTAGVSFPYSFEKSADASHSSSQTPKTKEEKVDDDNPICRTYRGSNDPNFIKNYRKEDSEEEEEEANEISVYPLDEILIANCGEVTRESIKVEDSRAEYEIEEEKEERDDYSKAEKDSCSEYEVEEEKGYDPSNEYYDEQAKKAWEEFHNTLFGESEYYEAFVREFNEKCWFA